MLRKLSPVLLISLIYYVSIDAQKYDHKIKVDIIRKDKIIHTKTNEQNIIQIHELSFNESEINRSEYNVTDLVGFEFNIDNQSTSKEKFRYAITYYPVESKGISGGLIPIILPPEEDENLNNSIVNIPTYPFTPENRTLSLGRNFGVNKKMTIELYLIDMDLCTNFAIGSCSKKKVSLIEGMFSVSLSNELPVSKIKEDKLKTKNNLDIMLYPNPLGAHLYINMKKQKRVGENTKAIIEIYTIQGVLLKKSTLNSINNKVTLFYDFINPSLKKGTYVYKITINGETHVRMLQKK